MIKLLVTDLDNTLYDWVGYFSEAFEAMVEALATHLGLPREQLLDEFKAVHQRVGNSEHPFAILELPSVQARYPKLSRGDIARELDDVLHAFNSARKRHLRLYPGVEETLRALHERGITVVGHTEAIPENAYFRLSALGILPFFRSLYAIAGSGVEHPQPERAVALAPPDGFVTRLPPDERKPNPRLLLDITRREGVPVEECMYVGDSLTRDVAMAAAAGCVSVWARYGTAVNADQWQRLVRVTHWTEETVAEDQRLRHEAEGVQPDYVIDSFTDLLDLAETGANACGVVNSVLAWRCARGP
jgi:FMN phosphatase YigB (HAD superfamily)